MTPALRWGSLGLGDVEAASRAIAPTLLAGGPGARAGAAAAVIAALAEESALDGLRAASLPERAVAAAALLVLVPLYFARGPGVPGLGIGLAWWTAAGAAIAAAVLLASPWARRLPRWLPALVAAGGLVAVGIEAG